MKTYKGGGEHYDDSQFANQFPGDKDQEKKAKQKPAKSDDDKKSNSDKKSSDKMDMG